MILTIDAGNSRTKWALFDDAGEVVWQGVCLNADIAAAAFLPDNQAANSTIIANVAGKAHAEKISARLQQFHINQPHWAKASAEACGLKNSYAQPETLGIDRWAAMIAAWQQIQAPCVVVNAGTAVTIDGVYPISAQNPSIGEFKGGLILPGLRLMQQSLGQATAQLPMPNETQTTPSNPTRHNIFAQNTADAILFGALHAIAGAITLMSHTLNAMFRTWPNVVMSGGDARPIYKNMTADVTRQTIIVDNLVLQGLYLLEKEAQQHQTPRENQGKTQ